jgi:hypothetical protein
MRSLSHVVFAVANAITAAVLLFGVFAGLPDRWLWVDVPAVVMALLLLVASVALLRPGRATFGIVRAAASVVLALGLVATGGLTLAAAFLSGVLGEIGRTGFVVFVIVIALVVPYLVVFPSVQLVWAFRQFRERERV